MSIPNQRTIHIVFDGPPGAESGRFIEVEDSDGHGLSVGEWRERKDGLWELVIPAPQPQSAEEIVILKDRNMHLARDNHRLAERLRKAEARIKELEEILLEDVPDESTGRG